MIEFLAATIRIATPILLAGLGGILSERAGVFAVGLEGMMLVGAFAATIGTWGTDNSLVGLLIALLGGGATGLVVALVAVRYRADNMVTGLAVNIVALGLTSYLMRILASSGKPLAIHNALLPVLPIPVLSDIPGIGPLLFAHPPLTYLTVLLCIGFTLLLNRTQIGLTLRATGENPEVVYASGLNPLRIRMLAVTACGAVAGLGGAVLSMQQVGTFTDGMTSGRGYLALAALIVGRWSPWGAAAACLVFGAAEAFELRLQGFGIPVSSYVMQMVPYLIGLAVLSSLGQNARMPAAIGQPLTRDR
ncbi:MAG: ABC transporter permease [Ancalomicrobiaceae bacterium]|nr:ABC transporter permease [Ancalomicrobiaceae bacterium]